MATAQQRSRDDMDVEPAVMPKYVPTGTTPPYVDSDVSTEEAELKAAKAASLQQMAYEQSSGDVPMPTSTEATGPHAGAAASSSGDTVTPTPRTRAAEEMARMNLGPPPTPREPGA